MGRWFLAGSCVGDESSGGLVLDSHYWKQFRLDFLFLRIDNFWIYLVVGGWVMAVAGSVGQAAVDIDDDYGAVGRVARG